jgi:hypothetical protein
VAGLTTLAAIGAFVWYKFKRRQPSDVERIMLTSQEIVPQVKIPPRNEREMLLEPEEEIPSGRLRYQYH